MGVLFWIVLMVALLIIEAMTYGLATIWFACGALVSAFVSLFVEDMAWLEWTIFAAVSAICLIVLRPIAVEKFEKVTKKNKTGIDTYAGQKAMVTEKIDNLAGTGCVDFRGQPWSAKSSNENKTIEAGVSVVVKEVKGAFLIVEEA